MQLAASGAYMRPFAVSDLHAPPHNHSPPVAPSALPAAVPDVPAVSSRLRVAAAVPRRPSEPHGPMQVTVLKPGPDGTTGDPLADTALRSASLVDAALAARFGRDGIDGRGGSIDIVVHAPVRSNAFWDGDNRRIELGDGDGVEWGPFGASVSVVAHELYHGVVDSEVKLDYGQAEQAALHESLADVFAAGVTGSWRIGEDVITPGVAGDAIRDLERPDVASMGDAMKAGGEPHALSGVASLAAVRAAASIGTDAMQRVWYRALVDHMPDGAGFADAARATRLAAAAAFGATSREAQAVADAWASVGVLAA